ncbi:hypothetical protein D3Y59_10975 [Hymenobacter oligotrophus]|uniref:Uncharacterized protein n=1 Tax=Hymenobacter oligotrophus TaxID=2319843 RepID=A0A3B7R174_9BACT|nr:hypothetical protein [Hymenobacter oligotrophus]AYA37522.1 hypothetical protein D3Y59_10975 [Hymenobacter oligotrophus]
MTTTPLSQAETLEYIKDVLPIVYSCIHEGHNQFDLRNSEYAHELTRATRSSMIRDYVVYRAKQELSGNPRIQFKEVQRMMLMVVGDKVALRFKKLTKKRKSVNILTKQVRKWREGQFIMEIPGIEAQRLTCIDVGYVNDAIGAGIDNVWAVALGDEPWFFNMTEDLAGVITPTLFSSPEELPEENPFTVKPAARKKPNDKQAGI